MPRDTHRCFPLIIDSHHSTVPAVLRLCQSEHHPVIRIQLKSGKGFPLIVVIDFFLGSRNHDTGAPITDRGDITAFQAPDRQ